MNRSQRGRERLSFVFIVAILWTWSLRSTVGFLLPERHPQGSHPLQGWSQLAELTGEGSVGFKDCKALSFDSRSYDLSSPREWMEFLEATEGQGAAYTVLRCDYQKCEWIIWGREFHMNRLRQSYSALLPATQSVDNALLEDATATSQYILDALLERASTYLKGEEADGSYTVMVTLLWHRSEASSRIVVRGHACCTGEQSMCQEYNPDPITATLALSSDSEPMPNRYEHNPEAKLSSWCRLRRPLEEAFKVHTGEVLLTRQVGGDVHILEGLTSNVFVIYPNGKLRTAMDGILGGYARNLVLDCAEACGLEYDEGPITLKDANRGLWHEVVLTSSIRLIVPVKQILIPNNQLGEMQEVWSDRSESSKWKLLYQEMLKNSKVVI